MQARRRAEPPEQAAQASTGADQGDPTPAAGASWRLTPLMIVLFIVVGAVAFWALYLVGYFFARFIDVLLTIFLAVLFSTFLTPIVNLLQRIHIPRWVSILLVYLCILAGGFGIALLAVPLFTEETRRLVADLPNELQRLAGPLQRIGIHIGNGSTFNLKGVFAGIFASGGHSVTGVAGQAVGIVFTIGTLLIAILAILVLAFLFTLQRTLVRDMVGVFLPPRFRPRSAALLSRMGERMGGWVIGQIIITIYYAVVFSVGLLLIGIPNPFSIGVITGALEIIPFVGGIIGLALAGIVAASISWLKLLLVVILYLIVTNVEAHILVPLIYSHTVHVHPAVVVVALLFGAVAFGVLGAIIAVPIAAALQVLVENLYVKEVVEGAERHEPPHRPPRLAIDVTHLRRPHAHE